MRYPIRALGALGDVAAFEAVGLDPSIKPGDPMISDALDQMMNDAEGVKLARDLIAGLRPATRARFFESIGCVAPEARSDAAVRVALVGAGGLAVGALVGFILSRR